MTASLHASSSRIDTTISAAESSKAGAVSSDGGIDATAQETAAAADLWEGDTS